MVQGLTQATFLTPPLDVRARRDGFALIYHLNELEVPSIYSSMFTNFKGLKERPVLVQRFVAALAEAIHFVEKNPDRGKAALAKIFSITDQEVLQSAYDAYAKIAGQPAPGRAGERGRASSRDRARGRHANKKEARGNHRQRLRRTSRPQRLSQRAVGQPISIA